MNGRALKLLLRSRAFWLLGLALGLSALVVGCRVVESAANVPTQTIRAFTPGTKGQPPPDLVGLQQTLIRFAADDITRVSFGINQLKRGTNAINPVENLKKKINFATETCSIASGPNALANLLDMTVFVTLTRTMVEDYWMPKVYGESAQPLLESCRNDEQEIWRIADTILTKEQKEELRQAIENWHKENPNPEDVLAARALGLSEQLAKASKTSTQSQSVFALIGIDPLAGLDPATREIAETRLFAERALFVAQLMPTLMRWQVELLTITALDQPAVTQLVTNTTHVSASVNRLVNLAEKLPEQVSSEREAIVKALQSQEAGLTSLSAEVRQTLTAGNQMSTSLNTTLTTFTALMQLFGVGDTNQPPPDPNAPASPPFNILDYAQTATKLEGAAKELTVLVNTLNQTLASTNLAKLSAQVSPVVQQAESSGKGVVDYAFWKGILLVIIALVAALLYRFLTARLLPKTSSKSTGASPRD